VDAVMFLDTSAIVALLLREKEAGRIANSIARASKRFTSPLVRLETCMVLSTRLEITPGEANEQFDKFLEQSQIAVLPITDEIGELAVAAFEKFGKGRKSKAKLNLADCMSYACAKARHASILFVGRDFGHTDLTIA
jgi:ribonuclease VapC